MRGGEKEKVGVGGIDFLIYFWRLVLYIFYFSIIYFELIFFIGNRRVLIK